MMEDMRFMSFLSVFQLYQEDVKLLMKGCVQLNHVYGRNDFSFQPEQTTEPLMPLVLKALHVQHSAKISFPKCFVKAMGK